MAGLVRQPGRAGDVADGVEAGDVRRPVRIDDDLANAAVSDPKKLEGLTRARAKAQSELEAAEAAWLAAEEALAEVA